MKIQSVKVLTMPHARHLPDYCRYSASPVHIENAQANEAKAQKAMEQAATKG